MGISPIKLALLGLISLALVNAMAAQNSPQDYLRPHNAARANVGVGPMQWDNKLASYAQNYANKMTGTCGMVHSGGPYGENLAWFSSDMSAAAAVKLWVDEKPDYHYDTNSCNAGKQCGHYTQIVWRKSVRLGCASVKCKTGGTFFICNYDPPGNYVGERPY